MYKYENIRVIRHLEETNQIRIRIKDTKETDIITLENYKNILNEYLLRVYPQINDTKFIKITNIDTNSYKIKLQVKCTVCGTIKETTLNQYIYNKEVKWNHSFYCTKLLLNNLKNLYDEKLIKRFYNMYYNAKTRATNENYKKLKPTYQNIDFGFKFFYEFYEEYFNLYLEKVKEIGLENINIDRINSQLGYVKGNIQFISSFENSGKKTINQIRYFDVEFKGKIYRGIHNTYEFAREHNLKRCTAWRLFNCVKGYSEKYKFRLLKKYVKESVEATESKIVIDNE